MRITLLLLPVFLLATSVLHAQIEKGKVQIGGISIDYTYQKGTQLVSLNSNFEGSGLQNLLIGFRFYLK